MSRPPKSLRTREHQTHGTVGSTFRARASVYRGCHWNLHASSRVPVERSADVPCERAVWPDVLQPPQHACGSDAGLELELVAVACVM